jgi:putative endonuclease
MNKIKGRKGEQLALDYLSSRKLRLIERNFTIWGGEIDLIMQDEQSEYVFVEVKFRKSHYVDSMELLSSSKIFKLIQTASFWIHKNKLWEENWRIDIVVIAEKSEGDYQIEWIKNAITE